MSVFDVGTSMYRQDATKVTPRQAFVLSDFEGGGEKGTLITEHPVDTAKGHLTLRVGRLLDAVTLASVLASFTVEADGWLPPNLIYQSRTRFAWAVPGKRRRMAFTVDGDSRLLTVPWPQLLLVAHSTGKLQVLALQHGGTPHRLNPVYHAPLMNIGDTGELCFGNATRPGFDLASIPAFEEAVFNTRFTHVNHAQTFTGKGRISNVQHLAHWQALHDAKASDLPRKLLRPMRDAKRFQLTLEQVLRA